MSLDISRYNKPQIDDAGLPVDTLVATTTPSAGQIPQFTGSGSQVAPVAAPSGTGLSKVIDLMSMYGAKFDGVTDDTAAWQAAINAVRAAGGGAWIHVPPFGVSIVSSTIDAAHLYGCTISARAHGGYEASNCEIKYTAASGSLFDFLSCDGVSLDGLTFSCSNAGYHDDLVTFDNALSGSIGDGIYNRVEKCAFVTHAGNPNSLLRLNHFIISSVKDCHFMTAGGQVGLRLGNNSASPRTNQANSYVNAVQITGCSFNSATMGHIFIDSPDCESVSIRDNTFEGCPGVKPLTAPAGFGAAAVGSGGSFAANTYFWKITAIVANGLSSGETNGSTEVSATIVNNGSANLTWTSMPGATGYKIYRSTSSGVYNSPALVTTIASGGTTSYTDTGSALTAVALPTYNSTGVGGAIAGAATNVLTNLCYAINIEDNWFGDASTTNVPWINNLRTGSNNGRLVGNQIYANTGSPTVHPAIQVDGNWLMEGNYTEGPIATAYQALNLVTSANLYAFVGNPFIATTNSWASPGVVIPNVTVGETLNGPQWSTFVTPGLTARALVINTIYQGAGPVQTRYMGAISSGPPTDSRQHSNLYDWYGPDSSGNFWYCTVAGTPGTFAKAGAGAIESVNAVAASGAAQTIPDVLADTMNELTLTANCTLTFPTGAAGKSFMLALTQDGTGSRTVTWPSGGTLVWVGGTVPTLTTAAGKTDVFSFVWNSQRSLWLGFVAGANF